MDIALPPVFDGFPRHRDKAMAASRAGQADPDVVGMAVTGSFATGEADELSDVDLRLYVRPDAVEAVLARVPDLAASCGDVVAWFGADHLAIPSLTIVLYDDLVHVDFDVVAVDRATEHNEGLPVGILWERQPISAELPGTFEADVATQVRWMEARIWTWSWYIQSKILRGELYEALDGLQYVRDRVLFRLLALLGDRRPAGGRRAESVVGEHADAFARTVPTALDPEAVLGALRAEIDLYRRLADPLLARHGADAAAEARSVVLRALELGMGWMP
ncbi:MAG: nucleotidyltransferase domain-containing protein [Actinomycetota bacterium]